MRLYPLLLIARRHLLHNTFRTAVSVLGVSIGVTFMIMLSALMTGFEKKFVTETIEGSPHVIIYDERRQVPDEFASWLGNQSGGIASVEGARPRARPRRIAKPLELVEGLRRMPQVQACAPNVIGTAILTFASRERGVSLQGIEPESQEAVVEIDKYIEGGRIFDLYASGGAVLIGGGIADILGVRRGDIVNVKLRDGDSRPLRCVGVFRTGVTTIDYSRCYTLVSVAQQLLGLGRDVNQIVLRLRDYRAAREVAAQIEGMVGYRTESWQEANENFLSIFVIQQVITYLVTGGIMIVAAFGILNVLVMLVMEKLPEIAMLKSMGYTRRDITMTFFLQGLAIGLVGVLCGCVFGYYLTEFVGSLPIPQRGLIQSEHLTMNNAPALYVIAGGAALAVTMLASVLPALRAGRLDPVETLRGHA
ncbi:MAG: ABC transporter permease [Planctomycetes bacterium]|nr:ABC transporter permease [Planctomycetota bacterium]MCL4729662.1 ABC transporter permease [Planctomycetota bacterium]